MQRHKLLAQRLVAREPQQPPLLREAVDERAAVVDAARERAQHRGVHRRAVAGAALAPGRVEDREHVAPERRELGAVGLVDDRHAGEHVEREDGADDGARALVGLDGGLQAGAAARAERREQQRLDLVGVGAVRERRERGRVLAQRLWGGVGEGASMGEGEARMEMRTKEHATDRGGKHACSLPLPPSPAQSCRATHTLTGAAWPSIFAVVVFR